MNGLNKEAVNMEQCDKCLKSCEYLKYGLFKGKVTPLCPKCWDIYNKESMQRQQEERDAIEEIRGGSRWTQ